MKPTQVPPEIPLVREEETDGPAAADGAATQEIEKELARVRFEFQEFLAIVSHDLQEPVRTVASYIDLLSRRYTGKFDQDADEFLGFAKEGATRIQAMIGDLLSISRVTTRGGPFELTDVQDLYTRALERLQPTIEKTKALVTCDPLPKIVADGPQMGQVLSHLLDNALKFRGAAAPRVHVAVGREPGAWTFSVRDHGIGIEAKDIPRLFQVFQRLHSREEYPGTGIGLALSKRIVERHGGRMWIESKPGKGTTVHFTIATSPRGAVGLPDKSKIP